MKRRTLLSTLPFVALAGCSGGESTAEPTSEPTATPEPTPTPTATSEATATAEPTPTETPEPTPTATPTETPVENPDQRVVVGPGGSLRFDPASFSVSVGDTVQWEWASSGHNIAIASAPEGTSWDGKDAKLYSSGSVHVYTFETAGTYEYYCQPHRSSGMTGSLTVE